MAKVSQATSRPTTACHANAKIATACKTPPIHRLVAIGNARAMKPPAKPPAIAAANPTPLMIVASSTRVKPVSSTNGVVRALARVSANLKIITKASAAMAMSRDRNSEKLAIAVLLTRFHELSRACAEWSAAAASDSAGSLASSVAITPTRTSADIATKVAR